MLSPPEARTDVARADVVRACRVLAEHGQGDLIWGHVAVRDPDGRGVWMKPSGFGMEEVEADDVVLVDREGEVLKGRHRRPLEFPLHTEAMAARPDVTATVHTHPEHAVAFGTLGIDLPAIGHEGVLFVPDALARYTASSDLVTTAAEGREVAAALGESRAVQLVNHGVLTVGRSIGEAVIGAISLEAACRKALLVLSTGLDAAPVSEAEALAKRARIASPAQVDGAWRYLCRRAGVPHPNDPEEQR